MLLRKDSEESETSNLMILFLYAFRFGLIGEIVPLAVEVMLTYLADQEKGHMMFHKV